MIKKLIILTAIVIFGFSSVEAKEVGGVNLPETFSAGDSKLILNGSGIREKFFMDIYVCGLYLKEKSSDYKKIIDADEPMVIRMVVVSGLMSSSKLEDAYRDGFEKATKGNIAPLKDRIEKFIAAQKIDINKKDKIEIIYVPKKGVSAIRNDKVQVTIKGLDFKKALFGIWIGDDPAQDDLKDGMLGK